MYKYVRENLEYIENVVDSLNNITEERIEVKIGYIRGYETLNIQGTAYIRKNGDLYLRLNRSSAFYIKANDGYYNETMSVASMDDAYVKLDENVFDKITKLIEKVYKDNRERKAFHEELNKQLKALTKTLEVKE